jgi:phosphatidate cytidylyltransferase
VRHVSLGNLASRVGTALIGLPALLAILFLAPAWAWAAFVAAGLLVGWTELQRLFAAREVALMPVPGVALLATFFAATADPGLAIQAWWPAATLLLLASVVLRRSDFDASVRAAAATALVAAYLGGLGGTLSGLRTLAPSQGDPWRVVMLCAIVMGSDTCAYFVGHALGRRRLAPSISPGKTVEGALGGLVGGVVGAAVVWRLALQSIPLAHALLLGAVVAACGMFGDLFESLLKRWAGIKDSGAVLPGHGGILDRIDGLLFGAPVLYYYFTWY